MTDITGIERMLRTRLVELIEQAAALDAALSRLGALRDADTDDEHDPDGAPLSAEWSRLAGIRRDLAVELDATRRAIERMEHGGFGVCVGCGRPIASARLQARPTAELCIDCAVTRQR